MHQQRSSTILERTDNHFCLPAWPGVLSTDILKVFLAGKIRNRLTPHNIHIINRINGVLLIIFGIALDLGIDRLWAIDSDKNNIRDKAHPAQSMEMEQDAFSSGSSLPSFLYYFIKMGEPPYPP
jgi:hypothetical protein